MTEHMTDWERAIEREKVEWVFGLTGGELERDRWVYWTQAESSTDGAPLFDKDKPDHADWFMEWSRPYWYQDPPEYAQSDFDVMAVIRTLVEPGGMLTAPHHELYDGDGVWRLKSIFNNSGETECPNRTYDPVERTDHQGMEPRTVTQIEANSGGDGEHCPLCEEKVDAPHGYIYLGDCGYEAVYELEEQTKTEDDDYGSVANEWPEGSGG